MANYKVVDADKLDDDLMSVADAIRGSAGTTEQMEFPDGFVRAAGNLCNSDAYLAAIINKTVTEIVCLGATGTLYANFQERNTNLVRLEMPNITKLCSGALLGCSNLVTVNLHGVETMEGGTFETASFTQVYFPSLTTISGWGFDFHCCYCLQRAYFPKLQNIDVYDFANCERLMTLILESDTVCTLSNINALGHTPISGYTEATDGEPGYVYVPSGLVDSYKAATNWSAFADQIRAIEDYPEVLEGWE